MTVEAEIEERIEWLRSGDPVKTGAVLDTIRKHPFGHHGTARAIMPLLESTMFYRIATPNIFCSIRLMAGAALAAEYDLLDVNIPVIVQQTPLQVWNYPENKELWGKIGKLGIPLSDDAHENFINQILGGLQMLFKRGELGLELHDYEMKAGKDVWSMAHRIEE